MAWKIRKDKFFDDLTLFDVERNNLNRYLSKLRLSPEEVEEIFSRVINEYLEDGLVLKKKKEDLN